MPAGSSWHPATDTLAGTAVYGDSSNDSVAWSIPFDLSRVEKFKFAAGDGQKWLVANKYDVNGSYYSNSGRMI